VDYIVLDSPILLSLTYRNYYKTDEYPATLYGKSFDKMVLDIFNQYDNINILLERGDGNHNEKERYQNLEQSKELDSVIQTSLITNDIPYYVVKVGKNSVKNILRIIESEK
jgi:hypothetical protein